MKRAITLAGGGPAAGLHLGVLDILTPEITFDVWALSCIGAWVGIVYNQCDRGKEIEQTYDFFKSNIFRDDASYSRFPLNTVFGADWGANTRALTKFILDPNSYENLILPHHIAESFRQTMALLSDSSKWNTGDINRWVLNHVLAPNPFVRYWTSMMYLSNVTGLSKICYPHSSFMKSIKFEKLNERGKPFIFHNAWNLDRQELQLFSNINEEHKDLVERKHYKPIDATTLCACSALPYIEETVMIGGETYCEGALVDTVNFKNLVEDHPDLDEIWVNRIVDSHQVRKPKDLHDSLANLCQLFAATVGEDDVKLFEYHVKEEKKWTGTIVEINVSSQINFEWTHANLDRGRERGRLAAIAACQEYERKIGDKKEGEVLVIRSPSEPSL